MNVHWHLGAEHLSVGEYDEAGKAPAAAKRRRQLLAGEVRHGFKCHKYDASEPMFTKEFNWKHCKDMKVSGSCSRLYRLTRATTRLSYPQPQPGLSV